MAGSPCLPCCPRCVLDRMSIPTSRVSRRETRQPGYGQSILRSVSQTSGPRCPFSQMLSDESRRAEYVPTTVSASQLPRLELLSGTLSGGQVRPATPLAIERNIDWSAFVTRLSSLPRACEIVHVLNCLVLCRSVGLLRSAPVIASADNDEARLPKAHNANERCMFPAARSNPCSMNQGLRKTPGYDAFISINVLATTQYNASHKLGLACLVDDGHLATPIIHRKSVDMSCAALDSLPYRTFITPVSFPLASFGHFYLHHLGPSKLTVVWLAVPLTTWRALASGKRSHMTGVHRHKNPTGDNWPQIIVRQDYSTSEVATVLR
ncbi:hypothetical protein IF2G_08462 [Cordyceps javanica]|nr:hypothetical protein IF2G_08462 [Cordyceps javanica]